ncbi:MAG: hypothetical protein HW416_2280 [Chloroflexi bacterium]|nr:hypothetical protein [Chloroflexota bacterium]
MPRKIIGNPKSGLSLQVQQTPTVMTLMGRPDPLLLYVVVAASIAVGIIGTVASSPRVGIATFLTFALLFSPLICIVVFNATRLKTLCVLDQAEEVLKIDEQSYTRRVQEVYPLADVVSVLVRRLPSAPLAGGASTYGLFFGMQDVEYLAASSNTEATVEQDAWRISRFLGVPIEPALVNQPVPGHSQPRVLFMTAALYLLPILLAISALVLLFDQIPGVDSSSAGLLGAIVVSQIGAIVAFAYYGTRRPYEN